MLSSEYKWGRKWSRGYIQVYREFEDFEVKNMWEIGEK